MITEHIEELVGELVKLPPDVAVATWRGLADADQDGLFKWLLEHRPTPDTGVLGRVLAEIDVDAFAAVWEKLSDGDRNALRGHMLWAAYPPHCWSSEQMNEASVFFTGRPWLQSGEEASP
jgi:hypothetical protein